MKKLENELISPKLWQMISKELKKTKLEEKQVGRRRKWELKEIIEGISWILRTGSQWKYLPRCYPPKSTVHRWYQKLVQLDFFDKLIKRVVRFMSKKKLLDTSECAIDGTYIRSRHEDDQVDYGKKGKGHKMMLITEKSGYPIGISISPASKHEIPLVEETLDKMFTEKKPKVILADKAYDSDPLDAKLLKERKIKLVAPHRDNRTQGKTQDGRELRRYKRRYRIERCFAWLYNHRRLQTRNEKKFENFTNFLLLGLTNILVKKLIKSTS